MIKVVLKRTHECYFKFWVTYLKNKGR